MASDGALGAPSNKVLLDVPGTQTTLLGLRATGSFTTARTIDMAQADNGIEVTIGNTLTLTSPFAISATTDTLFKNDNGILEINANNALSELVEHDHARRPEHCVGCGAVGYEQCGGQLATNAIVISSAALGAALQLNGGITVANPITINATTTTNLALGGGANLATGVPGVAYGFGGELENFGGTNTTTGVITMNADAAIGADAGTVLNINSVAGSVSITGSSNGNNPTTTARAIIFTGSGTINLNSNLTSNATSTGQNLYFGLNKYGTGTLNITTANTVGFTSNFTAFQGLLDLNGAGTITATNNIVLTIDPGASVTLDNTSANVNNRLGGRGVTFVGGNFTLDGATNAKTTESVGAPTFSRGMTTITLNAQPGQETILNFSTSGNNVAPSEGTGPAGATVLFRGTNLTPTATAGDATITDTTGFLSNGQTGGTGTVSKAIMPWALIDNTATGNGFAFATTDGTTGSQTGTAGAGLRALSASEYATANTVTANNNIVLTANTSIPNTQVAALVSLAPNSFTFQNNANLTLGNMVQLNNSSGGILVANGTTSTISGGVFNQTSGSSDLTVWTVGYATLNMNSVMGGGNGVGNGNISLVKAGTGTMVLNSPSSYVIPGMSGNTLTGQFAVNQGTLLLNGGTNTISYDNFLEVGLGGTLDLNGTSQYVEGLFTDGTVPNSGGTITGDSLASSTLVVNQDNTTRSFSGTLIGAMSFERGGQNTISLYSNSTYTGATLITGGVEGAA